MSGVSISMGGYSLSGNTAYYIDDLNVIKYIDVKTGNSGVLCSKPNCKHEIYDVNKNPEPTCSAVAQEERVIVACISINDKLYFTAKYQLGIEIYEYDYKNDNCEKVAFVENITSNLDDVVYMDGDIYLNVQRYTYDENIDNSLETGECQVCKFNIEKKSVEMLFVGENLYINKIYPANDKLYACCFAPYTGEGETSRCTYVYDGKKEEKISDIGYYYFDENNGYINPIVAGSTPEEPCDYIMKYNFESQKEVKLFTGWVCYAYCHYLIYLDNGNMYKYDSNSGETQEIEHNDDYIVTFITEEYTIYKDISDEDIMKTYVVETENFLNNNCEGGIRVE